MIPKSVQRFSEKIMLLERPRATMQTRHDDTQRYQDALRSGLRRMLGLGASGSV